MSVAVGVVCLLLSLSATTVTSSHELCSDCHLPVRVADRDGAAGVERESCRRCHLELLWNVSTDEPPPEAHAGVLDSAFGGGTSLNCSSCHAPHGSELPAALHHSQDELQLNDPEAVLDPVGRLCVSCHRRQLEVRDGGHFIQHPVGRPPGRFRSSLSEDYSLPLADVRGTANPDDDVISCQTCHSVHGGYKHLLRWQKAQDAVACGWCHDPELEDQLAAKRNLMTSR